MPNQKPPAAAGADLPEAAAPVRRMRGGPKGLRITDVAAQAGVAPITVSRVFNSPETVAPETLERVRQVVQKLGYVPNRLAGGLSSSRSRLIAAIVPTIAHSLFSETIQVFSETMSRAGYQVLLALSGYNDSSEEALLDAVLSRRPEGVLLTGVAHTDSLRERLANVGIPIVETWDMTDQPIDMLVGFSHYQIGVAVAEHFLQKKVRKPGLLSANDARALARRGGFRERLAQSGIRDIAEVLVAPPSSVAVGKAALSRLIEQAPDIDAVFCGSDLLAIGALGAAKQLGLSVPLQLAICGFGDLEFATETTPQLTSVRVDGTRIGLTAARCLLDRLAGADRDKVTDVGFEIVERATT
ncbi:LacI family DNA-binding transcriptional regulator [Paraburkholderia rhynchosiae]|uniref:GntR family transcriptional regulator n=1 Tax=Paraburkholderia rhynchosiae TaxID=487049 RepID=A0A2N7WSM8_9BURK|nr:LacI family DNA-binding transcriptional regulator [Paraburkholderia rhynchosiae]PMS32351.1 GntR family transcriptional regulator [Paraburkholderia rhynchosiae]CAB3677353.1 HTH-type transcriptional regulator GntR [Paraburkholderia rhynchosiae]